MGVFSIVRNEFSIILFPMKDKTILITGATSGIGKACAEHFAKLGAKIIITGRRLMRLDALAQEIGATPIQLDVRDREQVAKLDMPVDILINNAGLALASDKLQDGDPDKWETMIDTNVKGLLNVTKQILPGMIERNSGHIINIGSIAGHECYPTGNVYCATKHAVKALTRSMRLDLSGTAIRVSEVDPGAVETEFSIVRWKDEKRAKAFYQDFDPLIADDIADAVVYCATRPPHVNISELIVYPQAQAAAAMIHRT